MSNNPLVSICIFTYNSADYIIEALDSVAAQTYSNIELIVSDDASKDNTVEICQSWLLSHSKRFERSELVTVEKNTGVSANANRALKKCHGEWVKYFAGDDKLMPKCIEDNIRYINSHSNTELLFSDMLFFGPKYSREFLSTKRVFFEYLTPLQFKIHLLVQNFLPAPSTFLKKDVYYKLGGFDETIPMMEDKPFYIKALFSGCNINYMEVPTVYYRVGEQSLSQFQGGKKRPLVYEESREKLSNLVLEKLKRINYFLYLYQKNEYSYQFYPSFYNKVLHGLRFLNPAYYYIQYIFSKVRLINHFIIK